MRKEQLNEPIDVLEYKINRLSPVLLKILLKDNTTKENLRWATSTYEKIGRLYAPEHQMLPEQLIGPNINLLTPRVSKTIEEQLVRTKQKGEVFTPAWCCNVMNNYLDEDWFGRKNVFNQEIEDGWKTNKKEIAFSKKLGKTWQDYIADIRMELTCGEAPYLVSRYDVVKGEVIPVEDRIGILDRKLRVINENTDDEESWLEHAEIAYKSTYGYDYQGDNVLIARENLLYTLIDNIEYKFRHQPDLNTLKRFATIISWNIWQMDGFDYTVPFSEKEVESDQIALFSFGDEEKKIEKTPVRIKNWLNNKTLEFKELTKGDSKMKFDYIIGNPPYQDETVGTQKAFARPVYDKFMDGSYKIADKVELIHPARFLFNAGGTAKEWNQKILADPNFRILYHEQDSGKVFPGTDIMGGVVISYHDKTKEFGAIGTYTAFPELNSILRKTNKSAEFESFSNIVSNRGLYRFSKEAYNEQPNEMAKISDPRIMGGTFDRMPLLFFESRPKNDEYIKFYGLSNGKRCYRWLLKKYVKPIENMNKYKVFVPKANGSGAIGEVPQTQLIGDPAIGEPLVGCTETFISIGNFDDKTEANSCFKYVKTKFARVLLGVLKITQDNTAEKWLHVPMQNFSSSSDIDWSKTISEIDQQLYKKYNLSKEEIDFIESHVKEME